MDTKLKALQRGITDKKENQKQMQKVAAHLLIEKAISIALLKKHRKVLKVRYILYTPFENLKGGWQNDTPLLSNQLG